MVLFGCCEVLCQTYLPCMCFALQIVEVEMPFDKTKNQRKGFCFITFESEQVVQELLKSPKQSINGKEVILISVE
jgi:RNA recognition motif-containing protein